MAGLVPVIFRYCIRSLMKGLNGQADFLETAQNMVEVCSGMGSSLHNAQIKTTDALGISRKSLWEKIRKHKVKR